MKTFVILALVAAAAAAPQGGQPDAEATILRLDSDVQPEGYQFAYETSNGISGQEQGQLKQVGEEQAIAAQGQFAYTNPEGQIIALTYTADENGFQAQGAHLPTPPPIPEGIQRALEYIAAHPQPQPEN